MEELHDPGQGEVQRTEPHDGKDVRGIYDERVQRDGEDGGMESTAKITSVVSTTSTTMNSGVANSVRCASQRSARPHNPRSPARSVG